MTQVKKTHWFRTTLLVMIACGILGTCISAVRFITDKKILTYASSRIQFTFDGAASSVAPNGYLFDIKDIFCKEVIEDALKTSGFDHLYTVDQINDQLNIEGDYPDDINEQMMNYESVLDFNANRALLLNNYHPTMFTVKLYNEFDNNISKSDLEYLLQNIMASAKAYFKKIYSVSIENDEFEFDLADYDYSHQLTILTYSMNETLLHAQSLYKKAPTFLYNGYSFDDIVIRLKSLIDNDIDRMNANIIISSLTKNAERLLLQYQYEIENLTIELNNKTECLAKLDKLNSSYQKNEIIYLSNADSWTKIDGNSSETYDQLVSERKKIADSITNIKTTIDKYTLQMDDLLTSQPDLSGVLLNESQAETALAETQSESSVRQTANSTQHRLTALEEDINFLKEKHKEIKKDFAAMIEAYNAENINDTTIQIIPYRYFSRSLFSSSYIVSAFKTAAPLCALGFMVCLVLIFISKKKQQKTV